MIIAAMAGRLFAVSLCRLLIGTLVLPLAALVSADARANDAGKTVPVPARLEVRFAPNVDPAGTAGMAVEMQIPAPRLEAGKPLLRMPLILVSVPTAAYPASAIEAADTAGRLELTAQDEAPGPSGTYRNYVANRATQGPVTVRYRAAPREVSAATRNGPLFDLRREGDGLIGSGVYFMALPPDPAPINIRLSWDLPPGFRGVSSRGEGEQTWQGPADSLAYSFYATGPVRSLPEDGKGDFVVYWLKAPPMDPVALGTGAQRLYDAMAAFFDDKGSEYRIFARSNPYAGGGGTALEAARFRFRATRRRRGGACEAARFRETVLDGGTRERGVSRPGRLGMAWRGLSAPPHPPVPPRAGWRSWSLPCPCNPCPASLLRQTPLHPNPPYNAYPWSCTEIMKQPFAPPRRATRSSPSILQGPH